MVSFRNGEIVEVLHERPGLQRVQVQLGGETPARAYVLTDLIGPVSLGDRVVVNTTAVELDLGTGGWHIVHWNLSREAWHSDGGGHIMKARYTSVQHNVATAEEEHQALLEHVTNIDDMPVVVAGLHSQVAGIAAAMRTHSPQARIAYIMTESATLPIVISDLVVDLRRLGWIDTTITVGQAFGGDLEAVSIWSALLVAREVARCDLAIVAPGPGVVGTNTALGTTAVETGTHSDAVGALGGRAIVALRASDVDARERHRGLSHHSVHALHLGAQRAATIALPSGSQGRAIAVEVAAAQLHERHQLVFVDIPNIIEIFATAQLDVSTMGRAAREDPWIFACAAAAGTCAAALLL